MPKARELTVRDEALVELIHVIRGHRVMTGSDLARIYGVTTKRLNEQVKRNSARFPEDFGFRLTADEWAALRSQNATSKAGRGGSRYSPMVFTEHGALMLASVLNSRIAISTSVHVVRAFVRLRNALAANAELARKVASLEAKYDGQFRVVFQAIRELMDPPPVTRKRVGFHHAGD